MKCIIKNCDNEIHYKKMELCSMHSTRYRRYGTTDRPKYRRQKLIELGKSYCPTCDKEKLLIEFNKDKHTAYGISIICKDCNKIKANLRYKNNKREHTNSRLKYNFGITIDDYENLLKKQNHLCAICNEKEKENKLLSIDHCHETGKIRGLLCSQCNLGLGKFKDNIKFLENAINYLKGE